VTYGGVPGSLSMKIKSMLKKSRRGQGSTENTRLDVGDTVRKLSDVC
jgi:hypothetical protein